MSAKLDYESINKHVASCSECRDRMLKVAVHVLQEKIANSEKGEGNKK